MANQAFGHEKPSYVGKRFLKYIPEGIFEIEDKG